jgi:biopolymer transport protein ExbD
MSGSVGSASQAEPNLTPILDMVFQLITFFMLVLNFKAAELDLTLQLPVLDSAKPLPEGAKFRMIVLNVQQAVKCPHPGCDALAILERQFDEDKRLLGYTLRCEHGHVEKADADAVRNGMTCLSVNRNLYAKERRGKVQSIEDYLKNLADGSRMDANLTTEDIDNGKELPDTVVIRADTTCRFGSVNYVITKCQELGYRKFALKTTHKTPVRPHPPS